MSQRPTRVLIVYNEPVLPKDHPEADSEHDIFDTVDEVAKALHEGGYIAEKLGVGRDPQTLVQGVRASKPDVIFNLFEGLADWGETETFVVSILEWLGIPFTGCPVLPTVLARNKPLAKQAMLGAGIPTARFAVIERLPAPDLPLKWPVIVKPSNQDASVGIDQASVVSDAASLTNRVEYLLARYGGSVLVEEFIRGRELHVYIIEELDGSTITVLPPTEIVFAPETDSYWPIYSFQAKWKEDSQEFKNAPLETAIKLDPQSTAIVEEVSRKLFRLLHCRDFARIDLRLTPDRVPYILEMNPNPYINSIMLVDGLKALGRTFPGFISDLIERAKLRGPAKHAKLD